MAEPITVFTARTVRTMDRSLPEASAVAVSGGRIVEVGRHEDLVRAGGRYHELHEVELASRGA